MARKYCLDRGVFSRIAADGSVRWSVRLYYRYRARKFGSFATKTEAKECYTKAKMLIKAGLFRPEQFYLRARKDAKKSMSMTPEMRVPSEKGVYFIQCVSTGMVKIGFSGNIRRRMSSLQTASAGGLKFLGHIPGDVNVESMLHKRFASCRKSGEWFMPDGDLTTLLLSMNAVLHSSPS